MNISSYGAVKCGKFSDETSLWLWKTAISVWNAFMTRISSVNDNSKIQVIITTRKIIDENCLIFVTPSLRIYFKCNISCYRKKKQVHVSRSGNTWLGWECIGSKCLQLPNGIRKCSNDHWLQT